MKAVPVTLQERNPFIDILRGVGVLGILFANLMVHYDYNYHLFVPLHRWEDLADQWVVGGIRFLIEGKFISLFSVLFGLGFMLQVMNRERTSHPFGRLYARRLLVLFLIGLIHFLFIWEGDILIEYAMLGFLLFFFRKSSAKKLFLWSLGVLLFFILMFLLAWIVNGTSGPKTAEELTTAWLEARQERLDLFGNSSYGTLFLTRFNNLGVHFGSIIAMGCIVFAAFLIGATIARKGWFEIHTKHLQHVKKWRNILLLMGLLGSASELYLRPIVETANISVFGWLWWIALIIGAPSLGLAYAFHLRLIYEGPYWKNKLQIFAAVGRMALTNYLLQSIICTSLYYGYGGGLYGKIEALEGLGIAIVLGILQIFLSNWWLKHYRFGPVEWVWRSLTYGQAQAMKIERL